MQNSSTCVRDTLKTAIVIACVLAFAGCQSPPHATPATPPTDAGKPVASAAAAKAEYVPRYLDRDAIARLKSALPSPPEDRGALTRGEGDLILAMQAEATPQARERAKSEESLRVWVYADVLGDGFNKDKMPKTYEVMRAAEKDSAVITRALKERWARKRPPVQDDRITASVGLPKEDSYPSGHSVRAMLWACLLTKLAPEHEQQLLQRARLAAYDRVIGGVHYPTDVAAGISLGRMIAEEITQSAEFKKDIAELKAEWPVKP